MPHIFMAFVTERPLFFCFACTCLFEGNVAPSNTSQNLENSVFSKQNRAIWWILSGAIKVMKIKFQFYRLNQPNCALWMNFNGGQGWYTGHYPPGQTHKGILQPDSINLHNLHTCLSKQMPSVPEGCAGGGILSVRSNSGPAEGPGKILKYRSNLRLHPVNFSNKLCILFFIILSIWPNFLTSPLLRKTFWSPLLVTQNFFGPLHFAHPHQSISEHSLILLK